MSVVIVFFFWSKSDQPRKIRNWKKNNKETAALKIVLTTDESRHKMRKTFRIIFSSKKE